MPVLEPYFNCKSLCFLFYFPNLNELQEADFIEKIRPIRKNIYERFAAPCEIDYINESPENLFRIWVLKEAYFKCIGTGLGADIKNVTFTVDANRIRCSESGFEFQFLPSPVGYVAAVCIKTR